MNRFKQTASRGALIALIAAAPVAGFAQSDAVDPEKKLMTEQSADATVDTEVTTETGTDVAATDPAMEEETDTDMAADTDAMPGEPELTAETEEMAIGDEQTEMAQAEPAKPVDGQITMQDADTVLAEDLLGATVYNSADESVGDINDLIIGLDGSVKGVVIGVGGFLGLGEKQVAVEMAALDVIDRENGNPRLMTSATKTDLEAAPEFISASDQAAAQQMQDMPAADTMGGVQQPTE